MMEYRYQIGRVVEAWKTLTPKMQVALKKLALHAQQAKEQVAKLGRALDGKG